MEFDTISISYQWTLNEGLFYRRPKSDNFHYEYVLLLSVAIASMFRLNNMNFVYAKTLTVRFKSAWIFTHQMI